MIPSEGITARICCCPSPCQRPFQFSATNRTCPKPQRLDERPKKFLKGVALQTPSAPSGFPYGIVLSVSFDVIYDSRMISRRSGTNPNHTCLFSGTPATDGRMRGRTRSLCTFHLFTPTPVSLNNIHECEGCLSCMSVSVSDPVASSPNQPEFRTIAGLGKR